MHRVPGRGQLGGDPVPQARVGRQAVHQQEGPLVAGPAPDVQKHPVSYLDTGIGGNHPPTVTDGSDNLRCRGLGPAQMPRPRRCSAASTDSTRTIRVTAASAMAVRGSRQLLRTAARAYRSAADRFPEAADQQAS